MHQQHGVNEMTNIVLVNNTGCNITMFDAEIINAVKTGGGLPEELADIFTLTIITVNGNVRGILNAA